MYYEERMIKMIEVNSFILVRYFLFGKKYKVRVSIFLKKLYKYIYKYYLV